MALYFKRLDSFISPRYQKGRGRKKGKRLRFRGDFFYAQVVKGATLVKKRWRLSSVVLKGCSGKLDQCIRYIKAYNLGTTVHTAHIERWFGSLRSSLACLRRKSRCPVKDSKRLKNKVWIFVSLYNGVLPHASLKLKRYSTDACNGGWIGNKSFELLGIYSSSSPSG